MQRTADAPVDVVELMIDGEDDPCLESLRPYMCHLRTLRIRFLQQQKRINHWSRLYRLLQCAAPILEHLAILGEPSATFTLRLGAIYNMFGGVAPMLHTLQLMATSSAPPLLLSLPDEVRHGIRVVAMGGYRCIFGYQGAANVASILPSLQVLNLELRGWKDDGPPDARLPATLRKLNLLLSQPDRQLIQDALPNRPAWFHLPFVHVPYGLPNYDVGGLCVVPVTGSEMDSLEVRSQESLGLVHLRVSYADQRDRTYTGRQSC